MYRCKGGDCEEDSCVTPVDVVPTEKTLSVSGGIHGGFIDVENNDSHGGNDELDGDGKIHMELASQSQSAG